MQLATLSYSDASMTEYAVIATAIEFAWYHDQLMVPSLVSMELLARRFPLIEECYKSRLPQFDSSKNGFDPEQGAGLFLGLGSQAMTGRMAVCVMPELARASERNS